MSKVRVVFLLIGSFVVCGLPFFFLYDVLVTRLPSSLANPLVVYGFLGSLSLCLYLLFRNSNNFDTNIPSVLERGGKRSLVSFFAVYLLLAIGALVLLLPLLTPYGSTLRELGLFLGSLESMHHGLMPNIDFMYQYGAIPLYLSFAISFIVKNYFFAIFSAKILLDLGALILLLLLFRKLELNPIQTLIFLSISEAQIFFLAVSLHATSLRYVALMLPLIFALSFLKTQKYLQLFFLALSPFLVFLVSPETGLISFAYVWLVFLALALVPSGISRKELASMIGVHVSPFVLLLFGPVRLFIINSFYYSKGIVGGLVYYRVPSVLGPAAKLFEKGSLDGITGLVGNIMFYVYLVSLSVAICFAFIFIREALRKRSFDLRRFAFVSLVFFALGYFFKALGGQADTSYQSLTIFFLVPAYYILYKITDRNILVFTGASLILLYAFFGLTSLYFFTTDSLRYVKTATGFRDPRSGLTLLFPKEGRDYVDSLVVYARNISPIRKVLIVSDNSPGLSYFIARPNVTSLPFPVFLGATEEAKKRLVSDIEANKIDELIFPRSESEEFVVGRLAPLKEYLLVNLKDKYDMILQGELYEIYQRKD